MPRQPLMEDVEASWRIRQWGTFRYLGCPATVSAARWVQSGWWARTRLVLSLVARYRWARLRGLREAERLSESLYAEYYPQSSRLEGSKSPGK